MNKLKIGLLAIIFGCSTSIITATNASTTPSSSTQPAITNTQAAQYEQQRLMMAKEGCQKPIGFFPTPKKIMCLLTAFGINQNEIKPKALAIVFNVCHGRSIQSHSDIKPKTYSNLGTCLKDAQAINLINGDLKAQALPLISITNAAVLSN